MAPSSSSSSSSSWGSKLEKKLRGLADSASKESIQTIATWICFNRKHAAVIAQIFGDSLKSSSSSSSSTNSSTRQWLYWQIIHEILISKHNDPAKWDKLLDLRTSIGDVAVIPAIRELGANVVPASKLEPLLTEWDEHNVFGGPTLVSQIRRMISAAGTTTTTTTSKDEAPKSPAAKSTAATTTTTTTTTTKDAPLTPASVVDTPMGTAEESKVTSSTTIDTKSMPPIGGSAQKRRSSLGSLSGDVEYDFESKNVPKGKVDSREFLDPCKAIATLQIARDLRNDTAVQLSSLLSTLPKDIHEACQKRKKASDNDNNDDDGNQKEKDELLVLDKATIHDYSMRIPSKILDLDLEEQIQTIQTFQELIQQQQTARKRLIFLLLKSRCHFGSEPAAQAFEDLKQMSRQLERRKQLLGDALELEGLDSEIDTNTYEEGLADLPPLTWFEEAKKKKKAEEEEEEKTGEAAAAAATTTGNKKARIS